MQKYSIRPICLALGAAPLDLKLYRVRPGEVVPGAVNIFYIEGAKSNILIDAGATSEDFTNYGFSGYRNVQTLENGLARLGISPDDIQLVILTHLHFDHVCLAYKFLKAEFIVQRAELDWNLTPTPINPRPCNRELLDKLNLRIIDGDYQVEEGIKILFTPGHTAGGQSISIDTAKGIAVIDGMCCIDENYNPPESMKWSRGVGIPTIHTDPIMAYESLLRIKEVADILIPLHEARMAWINKIP